MRRASVDGLTGTVVQVHGDDIRVPMALNNLVVYRMFVRFQFPRVYTVLSFGLEVE